MIKVNKSLETGIVYLDTIDSGVSEDWTYDRNGDLFELKKKNIDIKQVVRTSYKDFYTTNAIGEDIFFESANIFEEFLKEILSPDSIHLKKLDSYIPTIFINEKSIDEQPKNTTLELSFSGRFLDFVNEFRLDSKISDSTSISIEKIEFDLIVFKIKVNEVSQNYNLIFGRGEQVFNYSFQTKDFVIIIPENKGNGSSLWIKGGGSNNQVSTDNGLFKAQQTNGDGWNDHSYYGGFKSPISKISHQFTIGVSTNAYCYIRFNNTNNSGTTGNPRIYQSAGNTLNIYGISGSFISNTQLTVGDIIEVIFTSEYMEVLKNNVSLVKDFGDYTISLVNSFVNFTAYRYSTFSSIKTKILS